MEVAQYRVEVDEEVRSKFEIPTRAVVLRRIEVGKMRSDDRFREEVYAEVRRRYTLDSVKDDPVFRAYRDFYWRIGIDPTKTRPSSEALVRRILLGKGLPSINPLVDVCNLVSALTGVTFSAFDLDRVSGNVRLTWSRHGERFLGIGTGEVELTGREVVLRDVLGPISIYPYRDSERTKTTPETRNVLLVLCGVPGIPLHKLIEAERMMLERIADSARAV
ncbi:MAG: phenylalanine--tRNA ligase beta subunit-related protein [Nitrososphaerota archaeon]|nr:phenylalanine--tRNA ligase beta subunit-related protein [Candidatus Calditenuis fumarioli]